MRPAATPPSGGPAAGALGSGPKEVAPIVMPKGAQLPGKLAAAAIAPTSRTTVKQEKIPVSDDVNVATRQTVEKMCEYIHAGMADEVVRWWAECGVTRYGQGNRDPQSLAWAMYWLVKHAILFARDEPRLFEVGEPNGLDMLIAPAVLVRMSQPKEDCDGFTMLLCALLGAVGVKTVIVTIAADPSDPSRWSHVFPMAVLPSGNVIPLDASHGTHPGWMVPRAHIFRWQAWDLNAQAVDVAIPRPGQGLHGYARPGSRMRSRGMGQDCGYDDEGNPIACAPTLPPSTVTLPPLPPVTYTPPLSTGGASPLPCMYTDGSSVVCGGLPPGTVIDPATTLPVGTSISGASTPAAVASVINNAISAAAKDAQLALLPAGSYIGPNGAIVTGQPGVNPLSVLPSSISGMLPIFAIGVVAFLLLSSMEKK
jgi:hypothetical protein